MRVDILVKRGEKYMECQECQKRPATLHLTQFINGQRKEIHVCEVCATEKGYFSYTEDANSLQDLLTGLFNLDTSKMHHQVLNQINELQCEQCGMTISEFNKIGKFGCATCYETFSSRLDSILRRVHAGNTKHTGKIPKRTGVKLQVKKEVEHYRKQLQHLIEAEEFEKAAEVRDKIKELERQDKSNEAGDHDDT